MGFTITPIQPEFPGATQLPPIDFFGPNSSPIPGNALYYDPSQYFSSVSSLGGAPFFAAASGQGSGIGGASGFGASGGGLFGAEAGLGGEASSGLGLPGLPGLPGGPGSGQFLNGPAGLPTLGNSLGYWAGWFFGGNPFGALQIASGPSMSFPGNLFPTLGNFAHFLGANNIPFNANTPQFSAGPVFGNVPHQMPEPHPGQGPKPFVTGSSFSFPPNPAYGFMPGQVGPLLPSMPSAPAEPGGPVNVPFGMFSQEPFGPSQSFVSPPAPLASSPPPSNFDIQPDVPSFGPP